MNRIQPIVERGTSKGRYFSSDRGSDSFIPLRSLDNKEKIPVQSVPITTKAVSSNPVHAEVYSIQHYVIKVVSDLRQVGGFLRVLRFPPPINITEILLNVALSIINHKAITFRMSRCS